jgi:hypothetical protein
MGRHFQIGSVTEKVLKESPEPVTIIPVTMRKSQVLRRCDLLLFRRHDSG